MPCYCALFGPQLFGHGTRVESHKSFGVKGSHRPSGSPALPRDHLESKLKVYNQFFNNKSHEIRSREVNDRLVLEGALRVYWGVQGIIHLKEDDDQRTVITVRKRNSCRYVSSSEVDSENVRKFLHVRHLVYQRIQFRSVSHYRAPLRTTKTISMETILGSILAHPV